MKIILFEIGARSALNQIAASAKGRIPNLADDGENCGSGGGVGDEDALDHPQKPYSVMQQEKGLIQKIVDAGESTIDKRASNDNSRNSENIIDTVKKIGSDVNDKRKYSLLEINDKKRKLLKALILETKNGVHHFDYKLLFKRATNNAASNLASVHCMHNHCHENEKNDIKTQLLQLSNENEDYNLMLLSVAGHL